MNDARLQALYRRMTSVSPGLSADEVAEPLSRHGYPDVEDTALDRIAASAVEADLLRTALALAPASEELAREVVASRRRTGSALRRWTALAASVGAAAVLAVAMYGGHLRDSAPGVVDAAESLDPADVILSASFESRPADRVEIDEPGPIFRGDFDS